MDETKMVPPAPAPDRSYRKVLIIIGAVLLVLVVLGAAYVLFTRPDSRADHDAKVEGAILSVFASPEEKTALYVLSPKLYGGVYADNPNAFPAGYERGSGVLDIARQDTHTAYVKWNKDTKAYDIVLDAETLVSTANPKQTISISPDGKNVAFAQAPATSKDVSPSSVWELQTVNAATKKVTSLGEGFAALYLTNDTLLVFAPVGVFMQDAGGKRELVLKSNFEKDTIPVLSPDRTLVAFRNSMISPDAHVYRIADGKLMSVVDRLLYGYGVSLSNSHLYTTRIGKFGDNTIMKYALTNESTGQRFRGFHVDLQPVRMIFN